MLTGLICVHLLDLRPSAFPVASNFNLLNLLQKPLRRRENFAHAGEAGAAAVEDWHPRLAEQRFQGRHRNLGQNNRIDIVGKLVDFR